MKNSRARNDRPDQRPYIALPHAAHAAIGISNTLYVSKGSGSNGINTVYQVGTAGSLPAAGTSTPISVLPGFNTASAKTDTNGPHPFGLYFANSTTLYVADEGSGAATDFGTSPTTQAGGLDKYSLVMANGSSTTSSREP